MRDTYLLFIQIVQSNNDWLRKEQFNFVDKKKYLSIITLLLQSLHPIWVE